MSPGWASQHVYMAAPAVDSPNTHAGPPKAWRSTFLALWHTSLRVLASVAIIGTVVALLELSRRRDGFVAIQEPRTTISGQHTFLPISLLWKFLPTFLVSLFKLWCDSSFQAFATELPFIEMRKEAQRVRAPSRNAYRSILLDYRTSFVLTRWLHAFKNGHWLLALCLLESLLFLSVPPLQANMFDLRTTVLTTNSSMRITSTYEAARLTADTSLSSIFRLVSATRVYGALPPPSTDGQFAFPDFESLDTISSNAIVNISLPAEAFSAYLACEVINDYTTSSSNVDDVAVQTQFSAVDRGCDVGITIVTAPVSFYLKTDSVLTCDKFLDPGSRLVAVVAKASSQTASLLQDIMFVSCMPVYRTSKGTLSKYETTESGLIPVPQFKQEAFIDERPDSWHILETVLHQSLTIEPNTAISLNGFGQLVLEIGELNTTHSIFGSSELLISSLGTAFTTFYAYLGATVLFQPVSENEASTLIGLRSVIEDRLHIVGWVAYYTIAQVAVVIILTLAVLRYLSKQKSVLVEEPLTLVAAGKLIDTLQSDAERKAKFDNEMVKSAVREGRQVAGYQAVPPKHAPGHEASWQGYPRVW